MSKDEEEEDDSEELGGGSRLLGFMFGNVDNSGDLDIDYLDEDAKEHLAALADKLGPSLAEIELIRSSPAPTDASEQDYDEKAEDAVDYEDIDEQYDGPEVQTTTEEDHLLPKKEYFSSSSLLASLEHKGSVFDEENYDEDEDTTIGNEVVVDRMETEVSASPGKQLQLTTMKEFPLDENLASLASSEADDVILEFDELQEQLNFDQEQTNFKTETSLPVLCVEDGMVILRLSEIFGRHEPRKRLEKRDHHKRVTGEDHLMPLNVADIVEEDEEVFLRSSFQNFDIADNCRSSVNIVKVDIEPEVSGGIDENVKDPCRHAQPMKDDITIDHIHHQQSPLCLDIYPFDHQDWEDEIIWGNSPLASHGISESCAICTSYVEDNTDTDIGESGQQTVDQNGGSRRSGPVITESFGSRKLSVSKYDKSSGTNYHQLSEDSESNHKNDVVLSREFRVENGSTEVSKGDASYYFNKLGLLNKEFQEGTWLDRIIWDSSENIPKPKLILDLQDYQMLFEVLDQNVGEHLRLHAGAMVINRASQSFAEDSVDLHNQGVSSGGRFNISNDKYYSNRKNSQQAKSHAKKRALVSIKVMHSVPALKLQTMKPKLSNKEIANFHRPKALWFPHCNRVTATIQGAPCNHGPMRVILMSLGGKPIIFNVNAEETLSAVKQRTSKKLDLRQSENLKVFYCGRELDDEKSLATQDVRPNSVLHLVRTRIHLWSRAQKLPGENKPMRPPGAFKKKSELSVKEGHVFLMEYCEERPLLLGNVGMGARLCTYYQKTAPGDQSFASLRNGNSGLGTVLALDPSDKSPFLGDISPGCSQSCIETNMYRAPIFPHKLSTVDFLLVRSAKGMLSLRRIDKLYVIGQQEPNLEVLSPGTKNVQTYLVNRMLVYLYREFLAKEKPGFLPHVRNDELVAQFPGLTEAIIRKRLKHCADLKKISNGKLLWVKKGDFRIPSEDELRRMLAPENVCSYESMQAGLYRLKRLGISRLTHPVGLSTAMNQLPDEAIALAAASHIERELQITSWNLTSNFVACTSQDRENIERLEITGVGDPSGRGLGFSYVRVTPKAPIASATAKKKAAAAKGGSTVTGTDADLRRLSMDAAREVLLKFKVPEEQIDKLTRWHRIALVRKLSSEQAASGVKVEAPMLSKFARGQRMSFLQLQQQTREKCQEIWDRQVQSLSAADGDENESDSEANSDLDSFAGDLENLLDAEECDDADDGNTEVKVDTADGVRGLKMRRCPSQAQIEEEIEDDRAEASLIQRLLEDNGAEMKKKKKLTGVRVGGAAQFVTKNTDLSLKSSNLVAQAIKKSNVDGLFSMKDNVLQEPKEVENPHLDSNLSGKVRFKKGTAINDDTSVGTIRKKGGVTKDGTQVGKEKKPSDKPVRENIVCGACGQIGHMRTNKNCPKYREDVETSELESLSSKYNVSDPNQLQVKIPSKKLIPKLSAKLAEVEVPEKIGVGLKPQAKVLPVKFKCGPADKRPEKSLHGPQTSSGKQIIDVDAEVKSSVKINKLIISNKTKSDDIQHEARKPSVVIRLPIDTEKEQPRKKIIIKQPKVSSSFESDRQVFDNEIDHGFRKIKKIAELSSLEKQKQQESQWLAEEAIKRPAHDRRLRDENEKRRGKERVAEKKTRSIFEDRSTVQEKHWRLSDTRGYEETIRKEESSKSKKKKKKKKKHDFTDEYLEHRPYRNDRRIPERDRAAKRRSTFDSGQSEYMPSAKRRRGGEVELSNILENIVESLKSADVSFLFRKPVTKKEAPDYFDIIKFPMDLSTIRHKVRNMEYKSREDFRHDVFQITYNAHLYNDRRNPHIPPLADQLLELCDYHLEERNEELTDAEEAVKSRDV